MATVSKKVTPRFTRSFGFFDDDGVDRIGVSVVMERIYWNFFQEAVASGHKFEAAIKTVVWGALCLESLLNTTCVKCLKIAKADKPPLPDWTKLQRERWRDKFKLVARLAGHPEQTVEKARQHFKEVMDLRNRLAHFSDGPTAARQFDLTKKRRYTFAEFLELGSVRASIETDLSPETLTNFRKQVVALKRWLEWIPVLTGKLRNKKVQLRRDVFWHETVPDPPASVPAP